MFLVQETKSDFFLWNSVIGHILQSIQNSPGVHETQSLKVSSSSDVNVVELPIALECLQQAYFLLLLTGFLTFSAALGVISLDRIYVKHSSNVFWRVVA